ncbi:conserved hypothetical protein [Candidatus Roizmanbacteria bacterium]|nr:conserved hypothetical protein [Candidatus Roizmanbacteria bacterium]
MSSSQQIVYETELIPILKKDFINKYSKFNDLKNYSIREEFASSYGIPDLIFYRFNKSVFKKRVDDNVGPILSKDILRTLLVIEGKKKITMSFLLKTLPYDEKVIKYKIINFLIKNNYLSKSFKDENYWVENHYQSCLDNLFSIEAKISDWKRGFYQAYRYKWFSNYSFLAIYEKYERPVIKNLSLFKKHNIGLVTVDTIKNNIKLIHRPKFDKPYSKEFSAVTFERLFNDYVEKKASSQSLKHPLEII